MKKPKTADQYRKLDDNVAGCPQWQDESGGLIVGKPGDSDPEKIRKDIERFKRSLAPQRRKEAIQAEAQRRILRAYPFWKQINILDEGGKERDEFRAYRKAVRDASNLIEAEPGEGAIDSDARWPSPLA